MIDVTGKNLLQEKQLQEYEAYGQQYIKPVVPNKQPEPSAIYKSPLQYLNSQVIKSHQYPNFKVIRPYDIGQMPPNKASYIDESIMKTTQVIGGRIYTANEFEPVIIYK